MFHTRHHAAEFDGLSSGSLDSKIIDRLPVGVCVCEPASGRLIRYNASATALWGRTPGAGEHYTGAHGLFSCGGEPVQAANSPAAQALRDGVPIKGQELQIERPDGSRVRVLWDVDLITNEAGEIVAAASFFEEVAPRARTEPALPPAAESQQSLKELHAEQERLLELFERSPAFMAVLRGPEHRFERVNGNYLQLVGERELIGKSVREAFPDLDGQGYFSILDKVYESGEVFNASDMKIMLRSPTGEEQERRIEFVYEPLRAADGSVSGILAHGIDLTQRTQAEESLALVTEESERRSRLYETILSATPDLIYVFDLDYRFTYANDALLKMWGKSWDEALGRRCIELGYEPWHAAMHEREIDQVVATKRPIRGEVPFSGPQGLGIYDYIFVPVLNAEGEVEAVAGTTRDITERKRMEEELQRRADELVESDRKKDEFIALLAHELRNPLAPIRNGLRVMELSEQSGSEAEGVRAMMNRQLSHMVRLIDDLLDVSRINQNKLNLRRQRVRLSDVIENAVESARPAIDAAGHKLTVALPAEPIELEADLTRLAQIFGNLLSNSTKYTERGGRIDLCTRREGADVLVTVTDNGIGIPRTALPSVFDMFSQVPSNVERSPGGLGIGLALVKALVEMHGGSVTATSDGPRTGSSFTVRLPVVEVEAAPDNQPPSATHSHAPRKRRILVVDDNEDSRQSMAMMLQILGHDIYTAEDGIAAVVAAEKHSPDLILMDVGMPRLNGYQATMRIREQKWGQKATIVALTGWGQDSDRAMSRAAGCDDHLVKPVNVAEVEKLVDGLSSSAD